GPFAGLARPGTTTTHSYDNNPSNSPCPHVMVGYTVRLTWAPPTDTLTLSAFGVSTTRSGGSATLYAARSYCTSFPIAVTGTNVADVAPYTVTVTRESGGGGTLAPSSRY
ncbi:MAG TPA: hypothetical protein VNA20_14710, partial [Frankiaceae bacterium]|nr:hypothetical protein [Frankiaceae bacterium]